MREKLAGCQDGRETPPREAGAGETEQHMSEILVGQTRTGRRTFPMAFRVEFLRKWDLCLERGSKTRLLREY